MDKVIKRLVEVGEAEDAGPIVDAQGNNIDEEPVMVTNPETGIRVAVPEASSVYSMRSTPIPDEVMPRTFRDLPQVGESTLEADHVGILTPLRESQGETVTLTVRTFAQEITLQEDHSVSPDDLVRFRLVLDYFLRQPDVGWGRMAPGLVIPLSSPDRAAMMLAYVFVVDSVGIEELNGRIGFEAFIEEGGRPLTRWPDDFKLP